MHEKENALTSADRCNSTESTASSMSSSVIPVEVPSSSDLSISYSLDDKGLVDKVTFCENHFANNVSVAEPNEHLQGPSERQLKSSSLPHGAKLLTEAEIKARMENGETGSSNASISDGESSNRDLEEELRRAQTELKAKDAEMEVLKGIRTQVEGELTDLTAALFEVRKI